jgi:aspartyl-tRNA(Asn)/glutamyl-tRNA(Gln) amidotransferase subunit A
LPRSDATAALDRIDPDLGAFLEVDADRVIAAADAPRPGRLSGVLIAVKDLIDTAALRTTYGSRFYEEHVPERSASVIEGLEREGAIVLGKTNLNEFAYGVNGYNPHYGPILNPRDRTRTAGGSSGGSAAAVAAGVCRVALGTDTSGSVRIPAACCAVYGLKCARGAYPMDGIHPLAPEFDTVGFFARGVEDLQLVLGLDALPDPRTLKVGRIGVDVEVPELPAEHWTLFRLQVWDVHHERFAADPERYGRDLQWKLQLPCSDVKAARSVVSDWKRRHERAVEGFDVLVGPMFDGAPPLLSEALGEYERDEFHVSQRLLRHTAQYNDLGWPALAVPTEDGPVQLAARPGAEPALLAVAATIGLRSAETPVV